MNVSQILNAAADKIEREGWFGAAGHGPNCALIAINACVNDGDDFNYTETRKALVRGIGDDGSFLSMNIVHWNNAPGRTKDEVVAMLRAVAATEKAREARLLPVVTVPEPVHA